MQNNRTQKRTGVKIVATTWIKDSHGLFDYQAKSDQHKKPDVFNVFQSSYILKQFGTCTTTIKPTTDVNQQPLDKAQTGIVGEVVIEKKKSQSSFRIKGNKKNEGQNQHNYLMGKTPFIVVKQYSKNGYPLQPGNIIKLGRIEYMVLEVRNNKETFTLRDTNHFQQINGTFQVQKKQDDVKTQLEGDQTLCKVCLCGEQTKEDPLISPCNCKGFCGLIHVNCLKTWINSKVKKQLTGIAVSYNFAKFQCQICKYPFPKKIKNQQKQIQMMTITKPDKPYLILESLDPFKDNKVQRCLHLIQAEKNAIIKIGRGHQCQIRLTDISVSRKHAQIYLKDEQFFLKDTEAKFGTLVLFQGTQTINKKKSLKIQMGRTLYDFSVQELAEQVDTQ